MASNCSKDLSACFWFGGSSQEYRAWLSSPPMLGCLKHSLFRDRYPWIACSARMIAPFIKYLVISLLLYDDDGCLMPFSVETSLIELSS